MSKLNHEYIGNNLKRLRAATDLSQHALSTLIPISKRSIAKIEFGDTNLSVSKANILLEFFDLSSLNELSDKKLHVPKDLREKLAEHHKLTHPEYIELLTKVPTIIYAIDYKLLPSSFFREPKQVREIRSYFAKFGWDFKSSSITNALLRKHEQIVIKKLIGAKDVNLYSKK